ncbi:fumarylacetoacetate hydrolase family protein [Ferdinandcohnia quinoae]|uniref:Fumarylacetoacetate hydrolase family protein n=1 Tax=Fredinandcohnia quinoae TaxID=2918902 RepID=A0AAW5E4T0_9BACI|nr:fumarylacetoacetate hydrolase family protein [Fredinandcohnia sp. SECRCQ15]MCH1627945.1 fumarylacetoacetate hydrolase family protein [Fredinandcohnia sp. SECRCQ15]
MKFVTFERTGGIERVGLFMDERYVIDLHEATNGMVPTTMLALLERYQDYHESISSISKNIPEQGVYIFQEVNIKAPLPNPKSLRDFYAFEQHVKTARQNRGLEMVPEWYEIPVFYFSNHLAIKGPNEEISRPKQCEWLDYELEIACIIGKEGKNIKTSEAEEYIFGYCIMNDWSARDSQRKEMAVGLGPAKGKDFATSIGPYIVTKDELESNREGKGYNLKMSAKVNGNLLSEGNFKDIYYSFAEMIERASEGVTLYPGEIIGSGTVGTGCILELGTEFHRWLEQGDEIELEITGLGKLKNKIAKK